MYIGLQDMFKIGIGPSSSHTVGPMRAARRFVLELPEGMLAQVHRVVVELFGSLAHTGQGHGTDPAVLMGLCGEIPDAIDTASVALYRLSYSPLCTSGSESFRSACTCP